MKPFQKLKVVTCFFIFISSLSFQGFSQDSYTLTGYRLSISAIKVSKSNGKTAKIEYTISNSGRNRVKLGKGRKIPKQLIYEFDASLNEVGLYNHADAIATALRDQKFSLNPGQLLMGNKLKVDLNKKMPDLVIVRYDADENLESNPSTETAIAFNEVSPTMEETPQEEMIAKEEITEVIEEPTEKVIAVPSTNPETTNPIVETTEAEDIDNKEMVSVTSPLETTESIILNSPKAKLLESEVVTISEPVLVEETFVKEEIEIQKEVIKIEQNKTTETITEPDAKEVVEEVLQPIETATEEVIADDAPTYEVDLNIKDKDFLEEDICADLVIESIRIIKQSSKSVTLEYVLANYGNGSAALFGESKKDNDNVAIKAHLAKSRKLTRGSIPLKGSFITKGIKNKSGMLLPKDKVTNTMKVDISKMTKFTPVLILSLDAFQDVEECNEFNNVVFINLIEVNEIVYDKPSRPKQETKVLSKIEE